MDEPQGMPGQETPKDNDTELTEEERRRREEESGGQSGENGMPSGQLSSSESTNQ